MTEAFEPIQLINLPVDRAFEYCQDHYEKVYEDIPGGNIIFESPTGEQITFFLSLMRHDAI